MIVYTRNKEFSREVLGGFYHPVESEFRAIVMRDGLEVLLEVEDLVLRN